MSLHWVGDIMRQVEDGRRDLKSATKEFKGVRESGDESILGYRRLFAAS